MNIKGSHKEILTDIFLQSLQAVNGGCCVEQYLQQVSFSGDVYLVAIGKAACSMTDGASKVLGKQIRSSLVITKYGHCFPELADVHLIEAGHPLPDQQSLEAGKQLISFINNTPPDSDECSVCNITKLNEILYQYSNATSKWKDFLI